MTAATLDAYAISRRQYSLLLNRRIRATRREQWHMIAAETARRCLGVFLFGCSIAVFTVALFGWLGV